jgi:hypothetical protein
MKMTKKLLFIILLVFGTHFCMGQNTFHIVSIAIKDTVSQLPIAKVSVEIKELEKKLITDKNGQLKFAFPKGKTLTIETSYPDYFSKISVLNIISDTTFIISLKPVIKSVLMGEIEVTSHRIKKLEGLTTGMESMTTKQVESLPSLGGENDLLKSLITLPGFSSGTEGTTELTVRGGTTGENLYLLDGYTLYKSSHLLGLLSVYNNQIVSGFNAYKTGFPAKYGGRISSVIDVRSIDPKLYKFCVDAEIGLLTSKATIQIPLIKGKSSLLIGSRFSYIDKLAKLFQPKNQFQTFNYYDLYGKWLLRIGDKNTLNIDFFTDSDEYEFYIKNSMSVNDKLQQWRNMYTGFRLNTLLNKKMENLFQAGYSNYENRFHYLEDYTKSDGRFEEYLFTSTLKDFFVRDIVTMQFSEKSELEFGGEFIRHQLAPSNIYENRTDTSISYLNGKLQMENELNFFGDYFYSVNDKLQLKIGIRYSNYIGVKSYIEPRLLIKFMPDKTQDFTFSYTSVNQPMHLLTNPGLGFSTDIWLFSNDKIKPATGKQLSVSWGKKFLFCSIPLSFNTDIYFKNTKNALEYRDGFSSNFFTSPHSIQNDTLTPFNITTSGQNDSYGIEFLLEKKEGRFTGWVSYTLAKSVSRFPELNKGIEFPSKYDRRHAISISATYAFNKTYQLSANWNYGSGLPLVIARYVYFTGFLNKETGSSSISSFPVPVNTDRNNYRMKATHTLNISASKKIKLFKLDGKLELGIYNVYYRKNPTYYTYDYRYLSDKSDQSNSSIYNPVVKMVSVLPFLPYFNISIHF